MAENERFICIHGHFYQPPRENPWLEAIEWQDSARPYHDWNERITAECYAPNTAAPILDDKGRVAAISNNYEWISFNFGPTLLSWLKSQASEIYEQILAADAASARRFGGHGSALAQAYNHMIMPLANSRDKRTQLIWGIRDFSSRYGRAPEGLWLPETAVDTETLELMAELGIKFTLLEPHQAARVRKIGEKSWIDLQGAELDPTMAYRTVLPSGGQISIFFYQGPISRAVAFERLLDSGEFLAGRLAAEFNDTRTWPQLVHIATDGETFGHHHRFGEMALAYALEYIEGNKLARLINYGEFLSRFPPTHEVVVRDDTSWSCIHGIERWRSDCGCNSGRAGWDQSWRKPLREALDWLRDTLAPVFEKSAQRWTRDPWAARDAYIDVILDHTQENADKFFKTHAFQPPTGERRVLALQALEMQRNAMLMYTSCGWFFDDLSGIETVQCMQYALRAMQLARQLNGINYEEEFLRGLELAQSNVPGLGNGRQVWIRYVKPAVLGLHGVAAHYGISSLFESYDPQTEIYSYHTELLNEAAFEVGRRRLRLGRVRITSKITEKTGAMTFGVVHLGEHNLHAGVSVDEDGKVFEAISTEGARVFHGGELPEIIRLLDKFFKGDTYSLRSLFKDELRRILDQVLSDTLTHAETVYRQLYEEYAPLMHYLREMELPLPAALRTAAEFALNSHLRRAVESRRLDLDQIQAMLAEATGAQLTLDMNTLEATLRAHLESVAQCIRRATGEHTILQRLASMLAVARLFPFEITLWRVRMVYLLLLRDFLETGNIKQGISTEWQKVLFEIGEQLHMPISPDVLPNKQPSAAQPEAS